LFLVNVEDARFLFGPCDLIPANIFSSKERNVNSYRDKVLSRLPGTWNFGKQISNTMEEELAILSAKKGFGYDIFNIDGLVSVILFDDLRKISLLIDTDGEMNIEFAEGINAEDKGKLDSLAAEKSFSNIIGIVWKT
jgi:hypothetical protein